MKPFDLSQYMFNMAQAAGSGRVGYNSSQTYTAGTVGAAIKALEAGAGGGIPASTMAQFDTACTDGNFAFQNQPATHTTITGVGAADFSGGQFTVTAGSNAVSIGSTTGTTNIASNQSTGPINMGGTTGTGVISLGRSTSNQTVNVANGATLSGNTKTVNIGAAGVSGSTTNINYGSTVAGSTVTHIFNGAAERMRITAAGDVGIGSNAPASRLHVDDGFITNIRYGSPAAIILATTAGTKASPTALTGSIAAGNVVFRGYDGAAFRDIATIGAAPDTTVTSTAAAGYLTFATTPSASLGAVERMRIDSLGNIIIPRDISSEIRFINPSSRGYRIIQNSSGTTLGSFYIQGTTDGWGANFSPSFEFTPTGQINVPTAVWVNGQFLMQHDGTNGYFRIQNNGGLYFGYNAQNILVLGSGIYGPVTDSSVNLGYSANRWSAVWAATGTIQTSDAREKDWLGGLSAPELAAAKAIARSIGAYRWLDSKIDDRKHIGVTAQNVIEAMEAQGLDPFDYGFVMYDEWEESQQPTGPDNEMVTVPAGNRYSVRYDELNMFIAAAQEQRLIALEALYE